MEFSVRVSNEVANLDLMTEVFEIIDSLTFSTRSISPTMWSFFPLMHAAFEDYAGDYIDGIPFLKRLLTQKTSYHLSITTYPLAQT